MTWYNNHDKEFPDTQQWNELIKVLQHVDKNILETTKTHREGVIITITRGTIDDIKRNQNKWTRGKEITLNFLLMNLYSKLGLTRQEILQCINEAAHMEGLKYDPISNSFTWS